MIIQIHCQESYLGCYIAVPEPVVELDAVINANPIGEADVCRVKVAVAISYPAASHSGIKEGRIFSGKLSGV